MWLVVLLQVFLVSVEQCESWLSNKEAFLSNQDPGVRTSSVFWVYVLAVSSNLIQSLWCCAELGDGGGDSAEEADPVRGGSGGSGEAAGRGGQTGPDDDPTEPLRLRQHQSQEQRARYQVRRSADIITPVHLVDNDLTERKVHLPVTCLSV